MLSKGLCQATRPRPGHEAAPGAAEGRGGARAAQAPALAGQEVSFQEAGTAQGVRFSHAHPPRGKHPSWHKQDGRVGRGKSNRRRGPEAPEHPQQGSGAPVSSAAWGAMHCDVSESRGLGLGVPPWSCPLLSAPPPGVSPEAAPPCPALAGASATHTPCLPQALDGGQPAGRLPGMASCNQRAPGDELGLAAAAVSAFLVPYL